MNLKKKSLQGYFFSSPPFFYIKRHDSLTLQMLKTGLIVLKQKLVLLRLRQNDKKRKRLTY